MAQGTLQELSRGRRSQALLLLLRDPEGRADALLSGSQGVSRVEALPDEAGRAKRRVLLSEDQEPGAAAERLVRALVLAGLDVASVTAEAASLEQVFAELTLSDSEPT